MHLPQGSTAKTLDFHPLQPILLLGQWRNHYLLYYIDILIDLVLDKTISVILVD